MRTDVHISHKMNGDQCSRCLGWAPLPNVCPMEGMTDAEVEAQAAKEKDFLVQSR